MNKQVPMLRLAPAGAVKRDKACPTCRFPKIHSNGARLICGPCENPQKDDPCEYAYGSGRPGTVVLEEFATSLESRLRELEQPEVETPLLTLHHLHAKQSEFPHTVPSGPGLSTQAAPTSGTLSSFETQKICPLSPFSVTSTLATNSALPRTHQSLLENPGSSNDIPSATFSKASVPRSPLSEDKEPTLPAARQIFDDFIPYAVDFGYFLDGTSFTNRCLSAPPIGDTMSQLHELEAGHSFDPIHPILETVPLPRNSRPQAGGLAAQISDTCDVLKPPPALFILGVNSRDEEPAFGGAFSDVYRAIHHDQYVALKRIRVFPDDPRRRTIQHRFCREALIWQRLKHDSILPFIGIDLESFPSRMCLVSPWMENGTILKYLNEHGRDRAEDYLLQIALGLDYIHSQKVVHGDLRGNNILIDEAFHVRICDMGLAVFSDIIGQSSHSRGSVRWMAPELHAPFSFGLAQSRRTFSSDIFSFACVCVELYTGQPPFPHIHFDTGVILRIIAGERTPLPDNMPNLVQYLVERCWTQNFSERIPAKFAVEYLRYIATI